MEQIKCNIHEIKHMGSFKYLRYNIVRNISFKEEITERIKRDRKILPICEGHSLKLVH
jgi:hypothetical protein